MFYSFYWSWQIALASGTQKLFSLQTIVVTENSSPEAQELISPGKVVNTPMLLVLKYVGFCNPFKTISIFQNSMNTSIVVFWIHNRNYMKFKNVRV